MSVRGHARERPWGHLRGIGPGRGSVVPGGDDDAGHSVRASREVKAPREARRPRAMASSRPGRAGSGQPGRRAAAFAGIASAASGAGRGIQRARTSSTADPRRSHRERRRGRRSGARPWRTLRREAFGWRARAALRLPWMRARSHPPRPREALAMHARGPPRQPPAARDPGSADAPAQVGCPRAVPLDTTECAQTIRCIVDGTRAGPAAGSRAARRTR